MQVIITGSARTFEERRYIDMSQAKVDRYKEEKRNRAKIMAREKRNARIARVCSTVAAIAIVGWAGYSVYDTVTNRNAADNTTTTETEAYTVNTSAITEYLDALELN